MVRSTTKEILRALVEVRQVVPETVKIHVFGVARLSALAEFQRLGVTSVDSASFLRRAWMGADKNFLTVDGWYSAIRVPQWDKSFRAKRLVRDGHRSPEQLQELEKTCLTGLSEYARGGGSIPSLLLDALAEYDSLIAGNRKSTKDKILQTLEDRPWDACGCAV